MAVAYVLASVSYGLLCATCSLLLGGTFLNGVLIYLVAGQLAMITLIGRTFLKFSSDDQAH